MRQADGIEGVRIQCVNRPALYIFKAFSAGDVQRITLRLNAISYSPSASWRCSGCATLGTGESTTGWETAEE
ncbi:hypothetical protein [Klebsiella pneumoniae]|nr:hypothetical protein [Klebsiella pneumoniae]